MMNIIFNFDRTLTTIEGPVELAKRKKIPEIATLTERAMEGEEPFEDVFRKRFQLYRPSLGDIKWLGEQYVANITPGAHELIQMIQAEGDQVFIVSAGYRGAILKVAQALGIPALHVCAVDIEFDAQGNFIGFDEGNILTTDRGLEMVLAEIARSGPSVYIGDSVRDLDAIGSVDLMIGYGGAKYRPAVEARAHVYIREPSLLAALPHIQALRTVSATPVFN